MKKLVVGSIVGNEKNNYLKEWLADVKQYADVHCVIDDASDDGTKEMLENSGAMVVSNKESMFKENEPLLRNKLWDLIRLTASEGDWVIIVDADEFYPNMKIMKKKLMEVKNEIIAIRLLDLWNNSQYRIDGHWSPYFHRMFKFKDVAFGIEGNKLHLPCVPHYVIGNRDIYMSDLRCHHYSYKKDSDKQKKYDFYTENVEDQFNLEHAKSILEVKPELKNINSGLPTILITSLIHNREWILPNFLKCLDNINYPKEKIQYCFVVNNNTDEGVEMIKKWNKKCNIINYDFDNTSTEEHKWDGNLIYHMAIMRNKTLDIAKGLGVDYMVNIDSDILFPPDVIKHLVATDKKIISPVFFAGWNSDKKLPQVWDRGGYDISQSTLDVLKKQRCILKVGGLGAFTAIHKDVWNKGVHYGRVYNLPSDMFGEDRDFCTRAVSHGFSLFASTYFDLIHIDNKEMLLEMERFKYI